MFSLVTTLARRHVFKYTFSIAQGEEQKGRDEQQEREVIPTRQCSTGRRVERLDQRFRVLRAGVKGEHVSLSAIATTFLVSENKTVVSW